MQREAPALALVEAVLLADLVAVEALEVVDLVLAAHLVHRQVVVLVAIVRAVHPLHLKAADLVLVLAQARGKVGSEVVHPLLRIVLIILLNGQN